MAATRWSASNCIEAVRRGISGAFCCYVANLWPVLDGLRLHAPASLCGSANGERVGALQVNVSVHYRCTALHFASQNGHTESVKALLEKGTAVNAENKDKCAFSCGLFWMGDGCSRPQGRASFGSGCTCRRHAGTRRCTSHPPMATRRA
jgi:hypothetical protein